MVWIHCQRLIQSFERKFEEGQVRGWPAIHAWLQELDPEAANLIHPNHSSRIERALEVRLVTGGSFVHLGQVDRQIPQSLGKRLIYQY